MEIHDVKAKAVDIVLRAPELKRVAHELLHHPALARRIGAAGSQS